MKIVVNTRLLLESRMEGIARYNYESLKRMVLAHPEDEFYFLFDRPFDDVFLFAANVKPVQLFPPTRHPILLTYWLEWAVYRFMKNTKPDVFFSGDTYMSLRSKIPTVLVCHDLAYLHYPKHIPLDHRLHYRYFFPRYHKKAAAIIAVSQYTRLDIMRQYNISPRKITVAHNAPNGHFYPVSHEEKEKVRQELTGGRPYFVYLGSIHPRKNLENLILGFSHFRNRTGSNHCLLIIGRPAWNTEGFFKTLSASPYRDDILHRQFKRSDLPRYIGSAVALCYVSLFEGFGIPILEGFEASVPVITSDISSMPEVAGDAALLANPEDPVSIGDRMAELILEEGLSDKCIAMGNERLKAFSWEQTAGIIYDKLKEVALSNHKSG